MEKVNLNRILRDIEIEYIRQALEHTGENISAAAELLGLKRTGLTMRLTGLGIELRRSKQKFFKEKEDIKNPFLMRHPNNIEDDLWNE